MQHLICTLIEIHLDPVRLSVWREGFSGVLIVSYVRLCTFGILSQRSLRHISARFEYHGVLGERDRDVID